MNAAINDDEARKFWREVYVKSEPINSPPSQHGHFAAFYADQALDQYAARFGDENLKREIVEWKQERAAGNTSH